MEFEIIEDLSALDAEALDAYIAAAEAAARELTEDDSATTDLIERALAILDSRDAAKAALESLSTAESERTQRLADVRVGGLVHPQLGQRLRAQLATAVEAAAEREEILLLAIDVVDQLPAQGLELHLQLSQCRHRLPVA